eukprot:gnl/Chilomastix_cuspidata/86.p1 GENE.gnl/Chilomastix_cuspidata/86~~gnl/Chilomastix_cuspidata/86.p1  ORF type:complete len:304 (-),score=104.63 gnl/Chilomastix_cuspidata/86:584-1495(-)
MANYNAKSANIQALMRTIPNTRVMKPDQVFHVPFRCTSGALELIIELPVNFPSTPPSIKVSRPLQHSMLLPDRTTVNPRFVTFSPMQGNLGVAVRQLLDQLSRGVFLAHPGASTYGTPMGGPAPYQYPYGARGPPGNAMAGPAPGLSLSDKGEIDKLGVEQIQTLLDSPQRLDEFLRSLPTVRGLESQIEKEKARHDELLAAAPVPGHDLSQRIADTRERLAASERRKVELEAELAALTKPPGKEVLAPEIRKRMAELEERCKAITDDFMKEDDVTAEEFAEMFIPSCAKYHELAIKAEKLLK